MGSGAVISTIRYALVRAVTVMHALVHAVTVRHALVCAVTVRHALPGVCGDSEAVYCIVIY